MFRTIALAAALLLPVTAAQAHDPAQDGIRIESAWARASAGAARNGAAFLTIVNTGPAADRILSASSPVAETTELHTHVREGEVMRMRPVEAIDVPADATVELKPGGLHVMLLGLREPLVQGSSFPVTLVFEKKGARSIDVDVKGVGDMSHGGGHGSHHKH